MIRLAVETVGVIPQLVKLLRGKDGLCYAALFVSLGTAAVVYNHVLGCRHGFVPSASAAEASK